MAQALPPSITGVPPAGFSPVPQPSGNPGDVSQALGLVREAVHLCQQALTKLPVGSEPHKMVMKMITEGSKAAPASEAAPGVQKTVQRNLANQATGQAGYVDVLRSMGGQGAAGMTGAAPGGMPGAEQPQG